MDRTAILADAIEYMKELLEKIGNLQSEVEGSNSRMNSLKNTKPSEFVVRNSPKVMESKTIFSFLLLNFRFVSVLLLLLLL